MKNVKLLVSSAALLTMILAGCSGPEPKGGEESAARPVAPPPAHGSSASQTPARRLPPYHESADAARPFPRLMPPERYSRAPVVRQAYEIAHRIPAVLAQQPCFCYCDKFGHRSLLDCYASDHGAG